MNKAKIGELSINFDNGEEYHSLKREIFGNNSYYIELPKKDPVIIDVGAHIGMAILYFKKMYPEAVVIAVEPNERNVEFLQKNIEENYLEKVFVYPVALDEVKGESDFYIDKSEERWWSTGSFYEGAWNGEQESRLIRVKTLTLADLIQAPVDLVKIDVEGAEMRVLKGADYKIRLIDRLMVEYHSRPDNRLSAILEWLEERGFETMVWKDGREIDWKRARGLCLIEATRV
jgi:FkbM family methyltransferase